MKIQAEIKFKDTNKLYLYDIKDHDRELVKEVCKRIREFIITLSPNVKIEENNYDVITGHGLKIVFDQIQKEYEDDKRRN